MKVGVERSRKMSKRAVIRIQLDLDAKEALDEMYQKKGMTQIAILSRLLKWFAKQDEVVQTSILGTMSDESMAVLARNMLERIGKGRR